MTYQLLNENYVPARNLKNTNIRNVIFFIYIYFNIGIYKLSHQLAVTQNHRSLYGLNRIFTYSSSTPSTVHTFCVGVTGIYSGKVLVLEVH